MSSTSHHKSDERPTKNPQIWREINHHFLTATARANPPQPATHELKPPQPHSDHHEQPSAHREPKPATRATSMSAKPPRERKSWVRIKRKKYIYIQIRGIDRREEGVDPPIRSLMLRLGV
jgi:hypothetical protein